MIRVGGEHVDPVTGPPDMRVSLFANAMSFPALIASIVGRSPAAPTIPVTTVSAVDTVAASTMPSGPWTMSGMSAHPLSLSNVLNLSAASGVESDATLGRYLMTWSAMSSALLPALRASTTKLSGHASTISSVWVPMDPVLPIMDTGAPPRRLLPS